MTYIRQERIDKILDEIYTELFKNSEPSADWAHMKDSGEVKENDFFMKYYLDGDEQERILNEVLKRNNIRNRFDKEGFKTSVYLGCAPNGCKETWKTYRKTE